jgi:glucose dehydrogenase
MMSLRNLLVRWHLLPSDQQVHIPPSPTRHLGRLTLVAFLLTFIGSRVIVILILTRRMPNLFFHAGGTHVHHLNYGIFLLSTVAAVLLFAPLSLRQKGICALLYGLAMGLTFDEFGMWLNLGGSYWQRASFDGVIVVLSIFGLIAFFPRWEHLRSHHYGTAALLLVVVASFYFLLFKSFHHVNEKYAPVLMEIEESGPR